MEERESVNWRQITALAEQVIRERGASWVEFWASVSSIVESWLSNPRFSGEAEVCEDHNRVIMILVLEKLQEKDYRRLREFFALSCATSAAAKNSDAVARYFRNWLRVEVRRIARSRGRLGDSKLIAASARGNPPPPGSVTGRQTGATGVLAAR